MENATSGQDRAFPDVSTCVIRPLITFALVSSALAEPIDFSKQIRPILSENCFFCHGPDDKKREAELRLDDEAAAKKNNDGVIAVVPGDPEKSALIERIVSTDPDEVMPPPKQHKTISPAQVALLKEWIKQGAKWGKHWSYEKVVRPAVPTPSSKFQVSGSKLGAVDAFLVARMEKEGLSFSPAADRATLIRRLALDLTGLPPTLEELARFDRSDRPELTDAVEFYLNKPAYGEHWAAQWLDLARYADSSGYPSDQPREIWAYRDWVIRALNSNMPFDQFTIEQNAGDLLPNPTDDQLIATAFHRNTMTQNEGGTDDEEFRNAAVIDRVNTTFAVWMGTTMACAQCHTHKYDPLTINEYFQFYAFLNQSADADKKDESPLHSFDTPETRQQREALKAEIAALESKFTKPDAKWLAGLEAWDRGFARDLGWQTPKPIAVSTKSKQSAAIAADGTVSIPKTSDTDTYTIELPATGDKLSALRLETMPAAGFGNFVISDVKAEVVPPDAKAAPSARYVRIELPGAKKMLQLAEVQVFSGAENIAPKGVAQQSSTYTDAAAKRANDGNTEGDYQKSSVSHTSGNENDPWWEVDLKADKAIDRVVVWNRTDGGTGNRLERHGVRLEVDLVATHRFRQQEPEKPGAVHGCQHVGRQLATSLDAGGRCLDQLCDATCPLEHILAQITVAHPLLHCLIPCPHVPRVAMLGLLRGSRQWPLSGPTGSYPAKPPIRAAVGWRARRRRAHRRPSTGRPHRPDARIPTASAASASCWE